MSHIPQLFLWNLRMPAENKLRKFSDMEDIMIEAWI